MIRKTMTVTDHQNAWIKSRIASGDYGNDRELFRDLIRREQAGSDELEALRAALITGEESGTGSKTMAEVRRDAEERLIQNGQI